MRAEPPQTFAERCGKWLHNGYDKSLRCLALGFLAGLLLGQLVQMMHNANDDRGGTLQQRVSLNPAAKPAAAAAAAAAGACPPCECKCVFPQLQNSSGPGDGTAVAKSGQALLQQFCPWDVSMSAFVTPDRLLDFGAGQTVCLDTIVYGYDLLFERDALFSKTKWLGVPNQQDPSDSQVFQEMFWRVKPDVIIELGTNTGGGALFYASIMSLIRKDFRIITIDPKDFHEDWYKGPNKACTPDNPCLPADSHPLWNSSVTFINAVPSAPEAVQRVRKILAEVGAKRVIVIEDSMHGYDMVLSNIRAYAGFVSPGSYLVVQDTKMTRFGKAKACRGHPTQEQRMACVARHSKVGPLDALRAFLPEHPEFQVDRSLEFLFLTHHAQGFLRRRTDA